MGTGKPDSVCVIELGGIGPGPFAGMLLADVVPIDPSTTYELFPSDPQLDVLNRRKRSAIPARGPPDALEAVLAMRARTDVLIKGFRPGVARRPELARPMGRYVRTSTRLRWPPT